MNKLGQFGIILSILFLGEILQKAFALPIPSTILGMLLLLFLLIFKLIKLEWVEDIGDALLDNLAILFIPAGVGIMSELDMFKGKILSLAIIIFISTIIVMLVTAYTVQILERDNKRGRKI